MATLCRAGKPGERRRDTAPTGTRAAVLDNGDDNDDNDDDGLARCRRDGNAE